MNRMLRRWLPGCYAMQCVALAFGFSAALRVLQWCYLGWYGSDSWEIYDREFGRGAARAVMTASTFMILLHAALRVKLRDPLQDADYLKWLQSTPWTPDHPLPLGHLRLDVRDILFVSLMAAVMFPETWSTAVWPATTFLTCYYAALACFTLRTSARWCAYSLAAGVGLVMRLQVFSPTVSLGLALLLALPAWLGVRKHLRRLPFADSTSRPRPEADQTLLGLPWPYELLQPRDSLWGLKGFDRIAMPLLLGWNTLLATSLIHPGDQEAVDATVLACCILPLVASAVRLISYLWGIHWANGFLVRWATRRPIDPAYDQVFVVPLLLIVLSGVNVVALHLAGPNLPIVAAILVTAAGLLTLLGGPSLAHWQLTCPARLYPLPTDNKKVARI